MAKTPDTAKSVFSGIIVDVLYSSTASWFQIKVIWHDERHPFYYSKHELEAISEDR